MTRAAALLLLALALAAPAAARAEPRGWEEIRAARPDLFHAETGFRIARQRAPTPADIPAPARRVGAAEARALIDAGAVAVDVYGAFSPRYDELDGTWRERETRFSIPGATWLPEVGRGTLTPEIARWFEGALARLTGGDRGRALVVFCVADCWMSWNAARRAAESFGYTDVAWFRLGTDGWLDAGWALAPVPPTPVDLD
ncbi:PQQ-dependent catabolism-associated CXXCW motif protein [Rhodovulum sp. DZ06]|uniref:PQQ-dependent catabolism-associated CXXCW motif protein n=1 Tax=Rhodovulum sp. DZ06 TaxID=3425126 RepID=UPI003D35095F